MKRYLLLAFCIGCRATSAHDAPNVGIDNANAPPALAGDVKGESGCNSPAPHLPTVQMMGDLTSSIGTGPITVTVDNSGEKVDDALLNVLATQIQIVGRDGREVPTLKTIKNVTEGMYGANGYRTMPVARIELVPSSQLRDDWHTLKVRSVPAGLAWPVLSKARKLADGSRVARFAPGSHPTPAAVRLCDKEDGRSMLLVDWSEKVATPSDAAGLAQLQEAAGVPADCVAEPSSLSKGATSSLTYVCGKQPASGAVMSLGLNRRIASASGALAQMAGDAVADRVMTRIEVDKMTPWGHGCRIARPW